MLLKGLNVSASFTPSSVIAKRVLQSKYCLLVPASLMYLYCNIPFQTFIKDTPKTATSSETRLSTDDSLLIRSIITRFSAIYLTEIQHHQKIGKTNSKSANLLLESLMYYSTQTLGFLGKNCHLILIWFLFFFFQLKSLFEICSFVSERNIKYQYLILASLILVACYRNCVSRFSTIQL